jgi:putative transcriptional regulator
MSKKILIGVVLREQGRTNKWFAQQMGKSVNTISLWVTQKVSPSIDDLFKSAKILGVSVNQLINEQAIPHENNK